MARSLIHPVILSGGSGTRLWPLSRALTPKQLLPLLSDKTLLQETVLRVSDPQRFTPPLVIANDEHRFLVGEQLRAVGARPQALVLEPEGRNTAPAICVAALLLSDENPDALLLVLPSDHTIPHRAAFLAGVERAAAVDGCVVARWPVHSLPRQSAAGAAGAAACRRGQAVRGGQAPGRRGGQIGRAHV